MQNFPRKPVPCLTDIECNRFPKSSHYSPTEKPVLVYQDGMGDLKEPLSAFSLALQEPIVTPVSPPPSPPIFGKQLPTFQSGFSTPEVTQVSEFDVPPAPAPSTYQVFNPVDLPRGGQSEGEETCSICLDQTMLLPFSLPLMCGHYVHKYCLRTAKMALDGAPPLCAGCGSDCVPLDPAENEPSAPSAVSSVYDSDFDNNSLSTISSSLGSPPINVKVNETDTERGYEYIFELESYSMQRASEYRYTPTAADEEFARNCSMDILGLVESAGFHFRLSSFGKLRILSSFTYQSSDATCYLFEYFVVIVQEGEVQQIVDLTNNELYIYPTSQSISFTFNTSHIELFSDSYTISKWMAAIISRHWKFPLAPQPENELSPPVHFPFQESLSMEIVICLPFHMLSAVVPTVLSHLAPQDRLGLVVQTENSYAYLRPCKPSWNGWKYFNDLTMHSCKIFTDLNDCGLDFVSTFFTPASCIQQSIIILPQFTCQNADPVDVPLYVISDGSSPCLPNAHYFMYACSETEIAACLRGLTSTLRTYTHSEPVLVIPMPPYTQVLKCSVAQEEELVSQELRLPIGALASGQTKSLVLELSQPIQFAKLESHGRQIASVNIVTSPSIPPPPTNFYKLVARTQTLIHDISQLITCDQSQALDVLSRAAQQLQKELPPTSTGDLFVFKSVNLVHGLLEICTRITRTRDPAVLSAILKEAQCILASQLAVTSRSGIERIFFEELDANVI